GGSERAAGPAGGGGEGDRDAGEPGRDRAAVRVRDRDLQRLRERRAQLRRLLVACDQGHRVRRVVARARRCGSPAAARDGRAAKAGEQRKAQEGPPSRGSPAKKVAHLSLLGWLVVSATILPSSISI